VQTKPQTKLERCRSKKYFCTEPGKQIIGKKSLPDESTPVEQLADLQITKIHTYNPAPDGSSIISLGFTWNDGKMEKWDENAVNSVYDLPAGKKIVKIDVTYAKNENYVDNLLFHLSDGTTKSLGRTYNAGRVETFQLAENEHLIGAEVEHCFNCIMALTFLTVKKL
jgi:hypothetical protein